ncbi:hypothetical protein RHGRI_007493 [Rhododendron griersonianum]|uniref:Uncharacterized protein n=1 Tax=Rhododendron griersonianum TaxID=479676 RepID=A0AAV6KWY6_9ERIC|nr:hypothetical protein RHGRI_007493 [Rhododendron griersonianum]
MTKGLKKAFKEDNIIKQTEVMAAMSKWWHEGFLRKHYDKTYEGSSSEEENDDEEVNDEESREEEADNYPPPPKKKKSKGESKKKKKVIELRRGVVFLITEEDVARVLGMLVGDTPVPTECLESHRQKIEEDFEGVFKGIEISRLENVIREGKTDGRFQRAYMLFALGCLLCPTTKEVAGNRLFPGVVDDNIETLKTYKWPAFVLDWLVNKIQNYKVRASKGRGRSGEGVGGSLFVLMVIYFNLNPLNVKIEKEPQPPIALWTKKLMDIRIYKEPEDKPRFINMYKDLMRQFVANAKSLHEMDAAMIEPVAGSPEHGSLPGMSPSISPEDGQDGPWQKNVQNEGHSPPFTKNFKVHQIEEEEGDK